MSVFDRLETIMERSAVAFDLETADKDLRWVYGTGFVRLAGIQADTDLTAASTTDIGHVVERLRDADVLVGHNILGFDLIALQREFPDRVDVLEWAFTKDIRDTLIRARLADPPASLRKKGPLKAYDLDSVGERLLGYGKSGDVSDMAKRHGGFDRIPPDNPQYNDYLRRDTEVTLRIDEALPHDDYSRREARIAGIAAHICVTGFRVDTGLIPVRVKQDRERKLELMALLEERFGVVSRDTKGKPAKTLNTAVGRVSLAKGFNRLGMTRTPPKTPSGLYATGKDAMEEMAELWGHLPGIDELTHTVTEATSRTFAESLEKCVVGDRVHPSINIGLSTGRWSSSTPNLLGVGKRGGKVRERDVFLAEPAHALLTADLSQVDARAVAALSGDPAYIALFEPGKDAHAMIADMVFGDVGMRDTGKPLHHSFNYGASPEKLAKIASRPGHRVPVSIAEQFWTAMHDLFPGVTKWRDAVREEAASGALLDNGFGRLMRPDPDRAWTQGPALMGQGCARDLMMEGLLNIPLDILRMLRAIVHDEVVLSVPDQDAEEIEHEVIRALSFHWVAPGQSIGVDIVAEKSKKYGERWGECY